MAIRLLKYIIVLTLLVLFVFKFFHLYSGATAAELDDTKVDLNDGPHLFWDNDSAYHVIYSNKGEELRLEGLITDSNYFNGAGYDSGHRYQIGFEAPLDYQYDSVSKFFAFSDTHGEFEYTTDLLKAQHIIDDSLNWSFGNGHLIIDGDLTDRGRHVTELLWLVYKLEQQAKKTGGMVHYLLGNHEIMVLQKDLRYINPDYAKICSLLTFDYDQLYSEKTELGRWLRSKNSVMKINNVLFVHGGLKADIIKHGYSIPRINKMIRASIDLPRDSIKAIDSLKYIYGSLGPFWYRGFHYEMEDRYPIATKAEIESLLAYYQATNIIVGHTVVDSVTPLFEGLVYAVNQDYEQKDEYEGLFWEDGHFYAADIRGCRRISE